MKPHDPTTISKRLSFILRHKPESVGLSLADGGWVGVDDLLRAMARAGMPLKRKVLDEVVAQSDKQRFEFSDDDQRIRARQGHSAKVDLGYPPATPPDVLYHGTATRFLDSIFTEGLHRGDRHHVHLSTDRETMLAVGRRHGKAVLLAVDAKQMYADGLVFHVTGNDVWLTTHIPPSYLGVEETDA